MIGRRGIRSIGRTTMTAARDAGGIAVLARDVGRSFFPPSLDGRELLRSLYKMGYKSVPIVVMTALFVGALMVIQLAAFVKQFNARALVGWGTGYSVLRDVGPILIGLMFSGRVGANNAAAAYGGVQQLYDVSYTQCMYAHGNSVQAPPSGFASYPYPAYPYPAWPYAYTGFYGPAFFAPSVAIGFGGGWGCGWGWRGGGWGGGWHGGGWNGGGWHGGGGGWHR